MSKKGGNTTHPGSRSAKSGQFVPKAYAKKHPATTVNERIPNPGHGDTGRGTKKSG